MFLKHHVQLFIPFSRKKEAKIQTITRTKQEAQFQGQLHLEPEIRNHKNNMASHKDVKFNRTSHFRHKNNTT